MTIRLIIATCAVVLLSACGSAPVKFQTLQPSAASLNGFVLDRDVALDLTDHTVRHLDKDKNILYRQTAGGGGAGLGLLLGPIGILANVKMIESRTTEDVALLQGKLDAAPRAWFSDAVQKNGLVFTDSAAATHATPYLFIVKIDGDRIVVSSAVLVEQQNGAEKWRGLYTYQIPQTYTLAELASLDAAGLRTLQESSASGFDALIKHMTAEKQERFDQEPVILFRSRMLFPTDTDLIGTLVADEGDVVWVRSTFGVYGMRKANMSYKLNKS